MKHKLQIILNDLFTSYVKFVKYKIFTSTSPSAGPTLEDQIEYLSIKFKSFLIEINYILTQLTDETNQNLPSFCFNSISSTLIEFMVI